MQSVNNGSPWWVIGNAYYCKDIVLVLRNAHCTKGVRKLMYKLRGVESRVYLPDLRRVDQCHENLAVRANSDVFDPLWWKSITVSDRDFKCTTGGDNNSQCHSRSGALFEQDRLHSDHSMERQNCGKRRGRPRISKSASRTLWDGSKREQGMSGLELTFSNRSGKSILYTRLRNVQYRELAAN